MYTRLWGGGAVGGGKGCWIKVESLLADEQGTHTRLYSSFLPISRVPLGDQVELNKAEVRWTRPVERLIAHDPEAIQTDELFRKFQGILNKLTPQKFQSLVEQALKLEINTGERLSGCIDKIFTRVRIWLSIKNPSGLEFGCSEG